MEPAIDRKKMERFLMRRVRKSPYSYSFHQYDVNLGSQNLSDEGIAYVCTLKTQLFGSLYLANNKLTMQGMISFSQADWTKIEEIRLSGNKIGNKGCKYLTQTFMPKLRYITLGENDIGNEGIHHLTKARWYSLRKIGLEWNQLSTGCPSILLKAFWDFAKLQKIGLNKISKMDLLNLILCSHRNCIIPPCLYIWESSVYHRERVYKMINDRVYPDKAELFCN